MASEASYVYILSEQKFIKNAKTVNLGEFLKTCVTRKVTYYLTKIGGKCQNSKTQMRQYE